MKKLKKRPVAKDLDSLVTRVTDEEALRFGKMDAEIRNYLQGIRLVDYEFQDNERAYETKKATLFTNRQQLEYRMGVLRQQYEEMVKGLAKKYRIPDPTQMSIDPDTGIIRDLRGL
jgi:hypothetical protein